MGSIVEQLGRNMVSLEVIWDSADVVRCGDGV